MKLSVIAPVKNEVDFIGYSIMAALPFVHEFIYAIDPKSDDGTLDLLTHIKKNHAHEKLRYFVDETFSFHPLDMKAYNASFNFCLEQMTGEAAWFLHPDMIVTEGGSLEEGPLAWWTNITSFAGDFETQITKGRVGRWKNLHSNQFGLHYYGGYGSENEDFYHRDITGNAYKHYGDEFSKYPFPVANSGISVNHYCELKSYRRRLEKMKLCLKTQHTNWSDDYIADVAMHHPRVTLEDTSPRFGKFEFAKSDSPIPDVISNYRDEFNTFKEQKWQIVTA
jgi:glycosyltransferase involved in cell wall biosynthesis